MQRPSMILLLVGLIGGCGDASDPATEGTTDASPTDTTAPTSSTAAGPTSSTTGDPDDGSTTAAPPTSSGESSGSSGTTGAPEQACGLEDLKPGTPDPIQSGTEAMQLPPDIAAILVSACGCHLADDHTVPEVPDYPASGEFDMTTWAGWHEEHPITGDAYHEIGLTYVENDVMPLPSFCNVDGEAMDPTDRATLLDWLGQGAPDGATWMP